MFLVSMADIIGSYERLPNDAVRAVAVAKRCKLLFFKVLIPQNSFKKFTKITNYSPKYLCKIIAQKRFYFKPIPKTDPQDCSPKQLPKATSPKFLPKIVPQNYIF